MPKRVTKLSVSLRADDEAWLRRAAERAGQSFSTQLSEIVAEARRAEAWREASLGLLGGKPVTEREIEAALSRLPRRGRRRAA